MRTLFYTHYLSRKLADDYQRLSWDRSEQVSRSRKWEVGYFPLDVIEWEVVVLLVDLAMDIDQQRESKTRAASYM